MMIFLRSVNSPEMATVLMCAALGIAAFTYSAMVPNSLDIAPRYAAIVYGIVNTFGTLAGAIGAMAAGYIVEATGSYDKVFMVSAGLLITAGIIYVTLGSGEAVVD
jgi:MFS transporter, ACS family, solute carrier family 17 (sodium-dependent inorganic phosphate cotransporter), other